MLVVKDLVSGYSKMPEIHGVSFKVEKGQVVAILGSNGAGKTTTLKTVMGVLPAMSGTITYKGESLIGVPSHKMVQKGLSMVPEGRHLFPKMSIYDNLMMGAYSVKIREALKRSWKPFMKFSRFLRKERPSWPGQCPAASSRWWPSAAR